MSVLGQQEERAVAAVRDTAAPQKKKRKEKIQMAGSR